MIKQSFLKCIRTPVKYAVLILLFTITFTVLCFAINYDRYVRSNILEMDKSFTTIAIPDTQVIKDFLPNPYKEENGYMILDYTPEADFYLTLRDFVETCENAKLDNRELLRGVSSNLTPVLSGAFNPLEYKSFADAPCNAAAFIVTVFGIEYAPDFDLGNEMFKKLTIYSGGGTTDSAHYVVKFRVDDNIVLNPSSQAPEFVYVSAGAFTSDGKCPFEIGKQYFISGAYQGVRVIQKEHDNGTEIPDTYLDSDENSVPSMYLDGSDFISFTNSVSDRVIPIIKNFEVNGVTATVYTYSYNELSQMCVTYEGDLDALLVEHPEISQRLDSAKINAYSIEICTTDNLNSVLYFNQGKASIMAGRNFTEKEINSASPVCVVSERFATFNNLKVGDSICIDLYNPIMQRMNSDTWEMTPYHDPLNINLHDMEISRGSLKLNVIGIYITQPWDYSAYAINDNTVFIPSNSVSVKMENTLPEKTEMDEMERFIFSLCSPHMIPALFAAIIPNDKLDDFKAEADKAGLGKYFTYNDQGYSSIKDTLPRIEESSRMIVFASFLGFLAVFSLYFALLSRKRHELGMLISIGAKRSIAVMSLVFGWFITILPALILCFITVILSSAPLAKAILNSTMEQLQYNDSFSVGAQQDMVDLIRKFNGWTNNCLFTIIILCGILTLYLATALIVFLLQSKQSTSKLLRRYE